MVNIVIVNVQLVVLEWLAAFWVGLTATICGIRSRAMRLAAIDNGMGQPAGRLEFAIRAREGCRVALDESQLDRADMLSADGWHAVLAEHRPWIERVIVARTGSVEHVDEVLQELSLAVAQAAVRPAKSDEIAPWLCTIVVRLCARIARDWARQQRKLGGLREAQQQSVPSSGDPIYWLLHEEQREIVRDELLAMPPDTRQWLVWKYVQGLSYADMANRLSVSRHVAEYRVVAARRLLRERLQARGLGMDESS